MTDNDRHDGSTELDLFGDGEPRAECSYGWTYQGDDPVQALAGHYREVREQ